MKGHTLAQRLALRFASEEAAKKIDSLRKKLVRIRRKGTEPASVFLLINPEQTLAAYETVGREIRAIGEAALRDLTEFRQSVQLKPEADRLLANLEERLKFGQDALNDLAHLIRDPFGYSKQSLLRFMFEAEDPRSVLMHYERVAERLWSALKSASSSAALLRRYVVQTA